MTIENDEELEAMRRAGQVVATVLREMLDGVRPGVTPAELDRLGARRLAELGAVSAPQAMYRFPAATCIGVNEDIAHGIPSRVPLQAGQLVNIDVSACVDGYYADNGASTTVGEPTAAQRRLLEATRQARDLAIAAIRPGVSFNRVARIFTSVARRHRLRVIANLCSHGIGRSLHESPAEVSPVPSRGERRVFETGQVVALEPFLTTGRGWVEEAGDGWTLRETAGSLSAQFEHTIVVWEDGAEVLTVDAHRAA